MDFGAFVQENRRWLIGCGVGFLVFMIGYGVISSIYDAKAPLQGITQLSKGLPKEMYGGAARDQLRTEGEQLEAEATRLQRMLEFTRSGDFEVPAGANASETLFQKGRQLRQWIVDGANERSVQIEEKNVSWVVPLGVDEIRRTLFGLELIDQVARRLFAASDAVRAADADAPGLGAILNLHTEAKTQSRSFRTARSGADLSDRVQQEQVQFKFEADAATIERFFEACRSEGHTLVVEAVTMQQPTRVGDPVIVSGSLAGIAFKKEQP